MNVTFTKTAERRYRVSVEGPGLVSSWMEPAPGYDERLPHDMAHFVVENELGIRGGVFGQLAAGGHAGTFTGTAEAGKNKRGRARVVRRGHKIAAANRNDASLSERIVWLACATWKNIFSGMRSIEGVSSEDIKRVCREFDAVSAVWSKLNVGESMTLIWRGGRAGKRRPRRR